MWIISSVKQRDGSRCDKRWRAAGSTALLIQQGWEAGWRKSSRGETDSAKISLSDKSCSVSFRQISKFKWVATIPVFPAVVVLGLCVILLTARLIQMPASLPAPFPGGSLKGSGNVSPGACQSSHHTATSDWQVAQCVGSAELASGPYRKHEEPESFFSPQKKPLF